MFIIKNFPCTGALVKISQGKLKTPLNFDKIDWIDQFTVAKCLSHLQAHEKDNCFHEASKIKKSSRIFTEHDNNGNIFR